VRVSVAVTAAAFAVNITSITTIIIWHHSAGPSLPAVWCSFYAASQAQAQAGQAECTVVFVQFSQVL
jgi:hypothetical protein